MIDAKTARSEAIEHNASLKTLLSSFEKCIVEAVNRGCFEAHVYLHKKTSIDLLNEVILILHQKGYGIAHEHTAVGSKISYTPKPIQWCLVSW